MTKLFVKASYVTSAKLEAAFVDRLTIVTNDHIFNAELRSLDETSSCSVYGLKVSKNTPDKEIVREWDMSAVHWPDGDVNKCIKHRAVYNGTDMVVGGNWVEGSEPSNKITAGLIAAIFDQLMGCCVESDAVKLSEYLRAAESLHRAGLVDRVTKQYTAVMMTPIEALRGKRVWQFDSKTEQFRLYHTIWEYAYNGDTRFTYRDLGLGFNNCDQILAIMRERAHHVHKALVQLS